MGFPGKTTGVLVVGVAGQLSPKFLNVLRNQVTAMAGEDQQTRRRRIAAGHRQLDALNAQRKWLDVTNHLRNDQDDALARLRGEDRTLARLRSGR